MRVVKSVLFTIMSYIVFCEFKRSYYRETLGDDAAATAAVVTGAVAVGGEASQAALDPAEPPPVGGSGDTQLSPFVIPSHVRPCIIAL